MTAPLAVYGAALRRAANGQPAELDLIRADGVALEPVEVSLWAGALRPGDPRMLARCHGTTLDIGCGPGRLTAALSGAGSVVLGVDICAEAVRQTRRRGAPAIRGDVFEPLPAEGTWRTVLLADGNIGIGGDPGRLLTRCATLLRPQGTVVAEVQPPGGLSWRTDVVLRDADRLSRAFPWAVIAAQDVAGLAVRAGFDVFDVWTEAGRWFAELRIG